MNQPTCIDLFCGVGGFTQAAQDAGLDVVAGIDFDEDVLETWHENFPDGQPIHADLTQTSPSNLKEQIPTDDIDVITAAPPCNTVSKVNRGSDTPTSAIPATGYLISELQPDIFVFENVPQLKHQYERLVSRFKSFVTDEYTVSAKVLNAADYGTPQHRLRYLMVGIRDDVLVGKHVQFSRPTHGEYGEKQLVTAGKALSDVDSPPNPKALQPNIHYDDLKRIPPGLNYSFYTEKRGCPNPKWKWRSKFSDFLRKADPDEPSHTLKANDGSGNGPYHWNNRRFSIPEFKQLMGFPNEFAVPSSRSRAKQQLGKAIPPQLAYYTVRAGYLQSKLRPSLVDSGKSLDVYTRKRTDSDELQRKAEEQYEELQW